MAKIKAFKGIRPRADLAEQIAALPYDVYNREEASNMVKNAPLSFLNIDRAETGFGLEVDTYDERVYKRAHDLLWHMFDKGEFIQDEKECLYLYELEMNRHVQTGIVACSSVDDYLNNVIKKHENTRADKEEDRIRHVDSCGAQTGPIFLAYRENKALKETINEVKNNQTPVYNFISEDAVRHTVYVIENDATIAKIVAEFDKIDATYIADGHHRAASAVKAGLKRRKLNDGRDGEYNYFLSVLFADNELQIMDYNRIVMDLNGYSKEEFLDKIKEIVDINGVSKDILSPKEAGQVTMYLDKTWYRLEFKESIKNTDLVDGMDVSMLQNNILRPILNIDDPKTNARIEFVGGIRGLEYLETRSNKFDKAVAFAMYPVSMKELFNVADAGLLMPPKSTWFEPKLRSGLFIHEI